MHHDLQQFATESTRTQEQIGQLPRLIAGLIEVGLDMHRVGHREQHLLTGHSVLESTLPPPDRHTRNVSRNPLFWNT